MSAVLLIGGSGFIGGHLVEYLHGQNRRIYAVNRGITWNASWKSSLKDLIQKHYVCDRDIEGLANCTRLLEANFSDVSMVVDFSCYNAGQMDDVLKFLSIKFGQNSSPLYVFISSDAVYEVCEKPSGGLFLKENDAVRPNDTLERQRLAKWDEYAEGKKQAEEVLEKNGSNFLALRLPDVIGPRDTWGDW